MNNPFAHEIARHYMAERAAQARTERTSRLVRRRVPVTEPGATWR